LARLGIVLSAAEEDAWRRVGERAKLMVLIGWSCDSPGVTFPLELLSVAVAARADTWTRLGFTWRTRPILPNYGKPVVGSEFESATWIAEIMIWSTGEAELATVRLTDERIVNKHYDLGNVDDLEALLDELVALLVDDRVPAAAVVAQWPGNST
jgi:hypothetical protein